MHTNIDTHKYMDIHIFTLFAFIYMYIYSLLYGYYMYIYFSLLQDCKVYYFESWCIFSNALHDLVFNLLFRSIFFFDLL